MAVWPDLVVAAALYAAVLSLIVGVFVRVRTWLRTPAERRIPLTPAPRTRAGVALSLLADSVLFTTLFRASRWTWLFGWLFHAGLALVLAQHLRYVTPGWGGVSGWLAAHGHVASAAMGVGLAGLWLRRVLVDRVRFVSRPSDHAVLALVALVMLSGAATKYLWPANVLAVKSFVATLASLSPAGLPEHAVLIAHLVAAAVLIGVLPWGKLMHGPGLWLNPVRYQLDDGRTRRATPRDGRGVAR